MRIGQSIEIDAPPSAVWPIVSDPAEQLRFWTGLTRFEVIDRQAIDVGARYRVLMRVGSADIGGLIEVVEWAPLEDVAWTSVQGVDLRGRWRLRARDQGHRTHVELRLAYGVAGAGISGWIAEHVAAPAVRSNLRQTLLALRRQVEHDQARADALARRETLETQAI